VHALHCEQAVHRVEAVNTVYCMYAPHCVQAVHIVQAVLVVLCVHALQRVQAGSALHGSSA